MFETDELDFLLKRLKLANTTEARLIAAGKILAYFGELHEAPFSILNWIKQTEPDIQRLSY